MSCISTIFIYIERLRTCPADSKLISDVQRSRGPEVFCASSSRPLYSKTQTMDIHGWQTSKQKTQRKEQINIKQQYKENVKFMPQLSHRLKASRIFGIASMAAKADSTALPTRSAFSQPQPAAPRDPLMPQSLVRLLWAANYRWFLGLC